MAGRDAESGAIAWFQPGLVRQPERLQTTSWHAVPLGCHSGRQSIILTVGGRHVFNITNPTRQNLADRAEHDDYMALTTQD